MIAEAVAMHSGPKESEAPAGAEADMDVGDPGEHPESEEGTDDRNVD